MQFVSDGDLCIVWGCGWVGNRAECSRWGSVQHAVGGWGPISYGPYGGPMQHAADGDPCIMQQMGA